MPETIKPAVFSERFITCLNADGNPVRRALCEMTADDVVAAAQWLMTKFERLDCLAVDYGREPSLLEAAEEAMHRHLHLMNLLYVAMPEWREHSELNWHEALRRYWPHGRAA